MIKEKNNRILISLIKYYITFVVVLAGVFILSYIYLGYQMSKSIENSNIPILHLISGNHDISEEDLNKLNGYIEILDNNRKVVKTIGDKGKGKEKQYTEHELLDIISIKNNSSEYFSLLNSIKDEYGNDYRVLLRIPKENISIVLNIFSVPYSLGKPMYLLYVKAIVVALILFIISVCLYGVWTAQRIKNPLKKINDALGKITEGDYEEKLKLDQAKEFVLISNTINFLIDKLKASNEENKKLEESKTRMLIDLSHDIKTPITTIRGFSAALNEGLIEDSDQIKRYHKTIYKKSERVAELVDDLFEFIKMDSTDYRLKLEKVDICEFLRKIVVDYIDELEDKKFDLVVNIPENIVFLNIDIRLFRRVITNLIENSIKYNVDGTRLRVELEESIEFISIEIADNGIGIPDSVIDKLFDPFVRGDESRKSDGGSGLCLAIAKKIVENHSGKISLLDKNEIENTIFYIRIPKDLHI